MKTILSLFSLILLFASCEDVIEIDLDTIEPKLVIEGSINDMDDQCIIKLSKTGDYFKPGIYPAVSDAVVTVTDDNGRTTNFEETEPGIYTSESIQGIENTTYTLNVWSEEENYIANVTMPQKVNIDSLSFENSPLIMGFDEGYIVNCHLLDPNEHTNYYRMKAYNINDTTKANESGYVFNDDFVNGNNVIIPWDIEAFQPHDTIVVEIQTLDKSTYYYYYTLFSITGDGFGISNPANPETNLNNNALGYFGTYTISRDTIVILPN